MTFSEPKIASLLKTAIVLHDTEESQQDHILASLDDLGVLHESLKMPLSGYSAILPAKPGNGLSGNMVCHALIKRHADLDALIHVIMDDYEQFHYEMLQAEGLHRYMIIEDATGWADVLQQRYQSRLSGQRLFTILMTLQADYNLGIIFCKKEDTAQIIWGILFHHLREQLLGGLA